MGSGSWEDATSYLRAVLTRVCPGDATLPLAVTFLYLNPWVAEGMTRIATMASQRRKYHRARGLRGWLGKQELLNGCVTRNPHVIRVQCSGCCAVLVYLVLLCPGTVHCGWGRSCQLEQGWALPCSWLVRKLAAAPVTLTTLELFLRLSCHIDLYPCSAFVGGSV